MNNRFKHSFVAVLLFIFLGFPSFAQEAKDEDVHELIIFLTRSPRPLDWESPSTLFKSVKKSWFNTMISKKGKRFLGHASFVLNSNLVEGDSLWLGIAPRVYKDMSHLMFKEKMGLGLLGIPFQSEREDKENIINNLSFNYKHTEVNFISILISKESAAQILEFVDYFHKQQEDTAYSPSSFYGGIYWPLYEGEGAGCTALCLGALEAGGIIIDEDIKEQWFIRRKIPMDLVGGRFNQDKKVQLRDIKRRKHWYIGDGEANKDYLEFEIYDPNLMMDWANDLINDSDYLTYMLTPEIELKGVQLDYSHLKPISTFEDRLQARPNPNIFTDYYNRMIKLVETQINKENLKVKAKKKKAS